MIALFLNPQRKLRNGWWVFIFFLVLAALVVPAILAASRHLTIWPGWQAGMALVASAICAWLRRERLASVLGPLGSWPRGVAAGIALGFTIWVLAAGVLWATGSVTWRLSAHAVTALQTCIPACLAVAVAEELIFRGFVFQRLVDGIGAWAAQTVMAAYFLLTHWNNPGMTGTVQVIAAVNIFLAGLLFGVAYLRTRSLALPIALHFMLNFTQGSVLGFGVSGNAGDGVMTPSLGDVPVWWTGGTFGLEASVPGTIVILAAFFAVARWRPAFPSRAGFADTSANITRDRS